jgi:hypothetical protein
MGRITDQNLARAGRLLKPRGDIYSIASRQGMLTCGRAGNDLTTVHTGANLDPDATLMF